MEDEQGTRDGKTEKRKRDKGETAKAEIREFQQVVLQRPQPGRQEDAEASRSPSSASGTLKSSEAERQMELREVGNKDPRRLLY